MDKTSIYLGRDPTCEIPVADDSVSRRHAELQITKDGTLLVVDCKSHNGTFLTTAGKEKRVRQAVAMPGDKIRFGECSFTADHLLRMVKGFLEKSDAKSKGVKYIRCNHCGAPKPRGKNCPECGTQTRGAR